MCQPHDVEPARIRGVVFRPPIIARSEVAVARLDFDGPRPQSSLEDWRLLNDGQPVGPATRINEGIAFTFATAGRKTLIARWGEPHAPCEVEAEFEVVEDLSEELRRLVLDRSNGQPDWLQALVERKGRKREWLNTLDESLSLYLTGALPAAPEFADHKRVQKSAFDLLSQLDETTFRRVAARCVDTHSIEDLVQEAKERCWASRDTFRGPRFLPWFLTAVQNTGWIWARRARCGPNYVDPATIIALPRADNGPVEIDIVDFLDTVLTDSLEREVFELHFSEGYELKEIAERLGKSYWIVNHRYKSAREKLRRALPRH